MELRIAAALSLIAGLGAVAAAPAKVPKGAEAIQLATLPAVSPDGKRFAFVWAGDIWVAAVEGGRALRLTSHPAEETSPAWSPNGREIAFTSQRTGSWQVFVTPSEGGVPQQITRHTEGHFLIEWFPDGKRLLVGARRDVSGTGGNRFYEIDRRGKRGERMVFDASGSEARLSRSGNRVLFQREGVSLYRKGYKGSQAAQLWLLKDGDFERLAGDEAAHGTRSPLWRPDGKAYYYLSARDGSFDLYERNFAGGEPRQITRFDDDSVMLPAIARNGSVIVFRHLFDFYRIDPRDQGAEPERIVLWQSGERHGQPVEQKLEFSRADNVSFSKDGLEIAFVAGGDLWVMDTVLREPRQITASAAEEKEPVFSPDGQALIYIADDGTSARLCRAKRSDPKRYWWQNDTFETENIGEKGQVISDISYSPNGKNISMIKGRGDLWVTNADGKEGRRLVESWNAPRYDWSPDSKWLAYSLYDNDFNRDIWLLPLDASRAAFNLSRHPDSDGGVRWSPDGRLLAFTGRRHDQETDIYYVWLREKDDQREARDRSLAKALETMGKLRPKKKPAVPKVEKPTVPEPEEDGLVNKVLKALFEIPKPLEKAAEPPAEEPEKTAEEKSGEEKKEAEPGKGEVVIDFDRIAERIRRISIPDVAERGLFWSHDSKKLGFAAKIKGVAGLYSVEFPDKLDKPAPLLAKEVGLARWLERDARVLFVASGVPGSFAKGKTESYAFKVRQSRNAAGHRRVAFRQAWRAMRDNFYDGKLNNRDWAAIGKKYERAAAGAADIRSFSRSIALMLGELNGSHLGFRASGGYPQPSGWREQTGHLGLLFDPSGEGEGLVIANVIPGGPCDRDGIEVKSGDRLLAIDDTLIGPGADLAAVLTGLPARDVRLKLQSGDEQRELTVRPYSYAQARAGLTEQAIEESRARVEKLSGGRLGYIQVARMMWSEFQKFEAEIYARGVGRDGLVIDVRNNGGGFTADHLLTVLNPPQHATTIPRGGGPGYPGDRRVYAAWEKPIVVLCNQNSFSNAEIFSHAIKNLGRGQLVGVTTAGGVISTGSTRIMDVGSIRLPFRGWYLPDGQDMELHGAVPHHLIWPAPGELPAGKDRQLEKAIEILLKEVAEYAKRPMPERVKASER